MTKELSVLAIVEATAARRRARRAFMKTAATGVAAVGGLSLLAACGDDDNNMSVPFPTPTPTPAAVSTDVAVLNFALNLEYLEAQFYSYAAFGTGLPNNLLTGGVGTQGAVVTGTGAGSARRVTFRDSTVAAYAREIAADEVAHVNFLRRALGSAAVAQPAIDIGVSPTSAFSVAAQAATLVPANTAFNPYASDLAFLYGAFLFEDVGVTAYKGASSLLTNKTYLDAAAGILAAEAYHASMIRTTIDQLGGNVGLKASTIRGDTELVSTARDSLDGTSDLDQGIAYVSSGAGDTSNIAPTDGNGIAFGRTTGQVLNIVYLNKAQVTAGGFFPSGVNGTIRSSANNA